MTRGARRGDGFLDHIPTDQGHAARIVSSIGASLGSGDVQARIGKGAFAPLGVRQVLIDAIASEVR